MSSEWITINRKCETWERIKFSSLSEEKWSCWKQRNRRIACFFCELWGASYANVILRTLRRTANPQMQRSALTCDRLLASIHVYLSLDSLPFSRERERERTSSSILLLSLCLVFYYTEDYSSKHVLPRILYLSLECVQPISMLSHRFLWLFSPILFCWTSRLEIIYDLLKQRLTNKFNLW
jgi:hypothetical protein